MYGDDPENVFCYLMVYNEPYAQPKEPDDVDIEGILKGIHRFSPAPEGDGPKAQILASGIAMQWALEAQRLLHSDWNVHADVWSVTSWNELRRDGLEADKHNFMNPDGDQRVPYVTRKLDGAPGPFVAVSDFMRAVQDQILPWVPGDFSSLGTDGWGLSDTRGALRRHFQVDAASIVVKTLGALAKRGEVKPEVVAEAFAKYRIDDPTAVSDVKQEGGDA